MDMGLGISTNAVICGRRRPGKSASTVTGTEVRRGGEVAPDVGLLPGWELQENSRIKQRKRGNAFCIPGERPPLAAGWPGNE